MGVLFRLCSVTQRERLDLEKFTPLPNRDDPRPFIIARLLWSRWLGDDVRMLNDGSLDEDFDAADAYADITAEAWADYELQKRLYPETT